MPTALLDPSHIEVPPTPKTPEPRRKTSPQFSKEEQIYMEYEKPSEEKNKIILEMLPDLERQKLLNFQAILSAEYPHSSQCLHVLYKFLYGKLWDEKAALKQYRLRQRWIVESLPHKITYDDVKDEVQRGEVFFYGKDKQGRPCFHLRPPMSKRKKKDVEAQWRYVTYLMEYAQRYLFPMPPHDQYVCMVDWKHFSFSHMNKDLAFKFANLGTYYPESNSMTFCVNPNRAFKLVWKIAKMFLDGRSKKKVNFCSDFSEMHEVVDQSQLLEEFGGPARQLESFPPDCPYLVKKQKKKCIPYRPPRRVETVIKDMD